jgi:hypothetical protein
MKRAITLIALFFVLSVHFKMAAQELHVLNAMYEVPQSGITNAAFLPPYSAHFAIGLGSVSVSAHHSGFAWNDLVYRRSDDSLAFDINNAIGMMRDRNHLNTSLFVEPLSLGVRFGPNYVSFSARVRSEVHLQYPKNLFVLLNEGNAPFIGENVVMKLNVLGMAWQENSIGYARQINESLSAGLRLKLLYGVAGANLTQNRIAFYTDDDMYDLSLEGNFLLNASYPTEEEIRLPANTGFGLDVGINYRIFDKLSVKAGINDLGRINWKENLQSFSTTENASFSFSGINISDLFNASNDLENEINLLLDSLEVVFNITEGSQTFTTPLPTNFHLGANYQFSRSSEVAALFYLQTFDGLAIPSLSVMFHQRLGGVLAATVGGSYYNNHLANLGAGLSLNLGPLQLYALSGNILPVFSPHKAKNAGLQFGLNFVFGRLDRKPALPAEPANENIDLLFD